MCTDPTVGMATENYIANKDKYLGVSNYTAEAVAMMEADRQSEAAGGVHPPPQGAGPEDRLWPWSALEAATAESLLSAAGAPATVSRLMR